MDDNDENIDYSLMNDGDEYSTLLCDIDKKYL